MIELLIIGYIILTVVVGFGEANYLIAQSDYWNSVPYGDYEFYENPGEVKFSHRVWLFPLAVLVCWVVLKFKA